MSGESTSRSPGNASALERAFGDRAACNRCGAEIADYRVIALFLHDTALVRAYCRECYGVAVDGEYHARGDGLRLDYAGFAERFGAPGPPPPPATPVDRLLATLLRDPDVRFMTPPSEAVARRLRMSPYRFRIELLLDGAERSVDLTLRPDGTVERIEGEERARERLRALSS